MNDINLSAMQSVSQAELENVEGGFVFLIAIAVFALELHIWDVMVSN